MKNYTDIPKNRPPAPPAPKHRAVCDNSKKDETCTWLNNEDYGFMSECGSSFHNDDNTIEWMNYCPYCGGKVIEQGKAD